MVGGRGSLGKNHLTGRTTMLITDTRCQQVNANCCPLAGRVSGEKMQRMRCLTHQRDTGTIALRRVTRRALSPLPWVLQCAAFKSHQSSGKNVPLSMKDLQENVIIIFFHLKKKTKILWRLLKSECLPGCLFSTCGIGESVYRERCFPDGAPPNI